ncbi:sensor histidine kinase NtrY-like [Candidatus Tisiphia endosymbiont of Nemotelus uliginosus]|uniref:sensor histidine kinase NtrY-like n=1 Tax=Candidatus Tisiphia endosymbiont of Nemotelus uliginosus TaxID=3077926 RepID=UPI0035C8AB0A
MFNYYREFKKYFNSNKILFIFTIIVIILVWGTYYSISIDDHYLGPDPSKVIGLLLIDLVVILPLGVLLARKFLQKLINRQHHQGRVSKLQNRIIVAFSLVTAIPTIIVSVFSAYFFNFGIQAWFDHKISAVLDQSIIVAESYIDEHRLQLRETALSVADDLSEMYYYYDLIHNQALFTKILDGEVEARSLEEAIVFHKPTNTIIANTYLSFSLSFLNIPDYLVQRANTGEIIEIKSDPAMLRMLIKLKDHNDIYLLVGRLIDDKIIDHIDKTNGAAEEYYRLKKHIASMQIKFSVVFILIALLLLLVAISWGLIFAQKIINPIKKLVIATEKIKAGDLTIQVPENHVNKDEISVLSSAFNRMVKQIDRQQRDLMIAQRALAWSDVARKVAHEIKNPLTPIHLASERLLRKFSNQVDNKTEFNKYIQMIINHTNDIKKIVSEFVNFARLPAPVFTSCDLVPLVKNIVDSRKLINDKILYHFTTSEVSIDFLCDTTQINQIMVNLLKNAEESIQMVRSQLGIITTSISTSQSQIIITVTDNGVGFPPNLISKAAEAYITTRSKGSGLGLAIIKKIAQDHAGTLDLANRPEGGAMVIVTFNIEELQLKSLESAPY